MSMFKGPKKDKSLARIQQRKEFEARDEKNDLLLEEKGQQGVLQGRAQGRRLLSAKRGLMGGGRKTLN